MAIHTIKAGDNLWRISAAYGVPIPTLKAVNGLVSNRLVPGLNLYIPDQSLPEQYYQIKPGDTYWKLSQQFNTSIQAIIAANPTLDPNALPIGLRVRIPSLEKYRMQSLVFFDALAGTPYLDTLTKIAASITYLAIFTYSFTRDGELIGIDDALILQRAKELNIKPLLVISNYEGNMFSPGLANDVLQNKEKRTVLVQNLVRVVKAKGYAGVSIDFEFVPPERRNDFTAFLRELKNGLGTLVLQLNAHAKSSDMATNRLVGFLDYKATGAIVDIVSIMTIDYGYAIGPPDPIAPVWWVEQVLMYATGQINRRKIMLAMSLYGYDWIVPIQAEVVAGMIPMQIAQNRAIDSWIPITYDEVAQAPHYRYRLPNSEHIVWFEDIRSITWKYKQMEAYNLLGATYWRLRFSFPQNWAYVGKNLLVMK
ncbi:LysM peptidoglycan-binding domain-containing protein [Guptibacillus algicola]|uniref:LysM peptidoglycan-binding domain-containing protein n=1 Tax=Guptibacillus algicola TaxID=225844 RepID=UPI001CD651ED|nr:LysM peptidoglycan-binding domain-containing protein [Alkalihalobacillus algicola]MCA0987001.1 LysM peptidoglycan-binding domain-containing protein [Alkalihalobacillus algicola]